MRTRYANVAATLAVAVSLSSGAYAFTLAKGSVKTKHIQKNAVTKSRIAKNSVVSAKVKNGSLRAADFRAGQLPQGQPGAAGEQGDPGLSELEYVREAFTDLGPGVTATYTVECPAGKSPIAGGHEVNQGSYLRSTKAVNSAGSTSAAYDAWQVSIQNVSVNGSSASGYAYALCASVQGGFPNPGWATN